MKITEVSADGLGVSALIAAAGAIHEMLDERNVSLVLVEGADLGVEQPWVACVIGKRDAEAGPPHLGVTVERNPRVFTIGRDEPKAKPEHLESYGDHYPDGRGMLCVCTRGCCNAEDETCICPPCTNLSHEHPVSRG
jgi:hypothetical protein